MTARAADGLFHPSTEAELVELICLARARGVKLRVRGSGHSPAPAVLTADARDIHVALDRMTSLSFDDSRQQVTVQAGCTLKSLFRQLDARGWALPSTAGITHQTVAGFLSTGSSGGSLLPSLGGQVVALRLIDGLGVVHDLRKDEDPNNPFYAAGVSLGLLGVLTAVTFQCVDSFTVVGSETTSAYDDCEVDLFGGGANGKPSLERFLRTREHARLMWFPQPGVERITVWQARRRTPDDGPDVRRPYHVFPLIGGSMRPAQLCLNLLLGTLDVINPPAPRTRAGRALRAGLERSYPRLAGLFLGPGTQAFRDTWWQGLPMDDEVDNALLPTAFTEMWFRLDKAGDVVRDLAAYYASGGYRATGTFSCEIYCTPRSRFWLSPAVDQDVVKINLFWFARNRGDPTTEFFPAVWQRLRPHGYRLHWGKLLSGDVTYLRQQYPRWDDFMALRERLDPRQVFVSEYWRTHLGISG
jgi:FAD binding domain/D-arabinono-1,4-lactone oxidase